MGMLQSNGSTKHWAELSLRRSHLSQNNPIPFLHVEIQVPAEAGPPDALHSSRSTQGGGAVGLPDCHFSNNQTTGHRVRKIPKVLCLPSAQEQPVCLPLSLIHMESYPHIHTKAETSATMYNVLYSI